MLFHATGDDRTAAAIGRLITACGFDLRKDRRVTQTGRIGVPAAACTKTAGPAASSPAPARDTPSRPLTNQKLGFWRIGRDQAQARRMYARLGSAKNPLIFSGAFQSARSA